MARGARRPVLSATDVAVIPGLYLELGDAFVERLAGVFAIAVWDPRTQRLILARDRAGERPLFYYHHDGVVRFATEISALAVDPALELTPDRRALGRYVAGYFTAPETPFTEVRKVAPGEVVVVERGGATHRRCWRWSITTAARRVPTVAAFDEVFREAVRSQSDAEVECGVFLSGGLDSSLVAAVAKDLAPQKRLRAYTLRFREASYDEGEHRRGGGAPAPARLDTGPRDPGGPPGGPAGAHPPGGRAARGPGLGADRAPGPPGLAM